MWLIVGLGNIGSSYQNNRHNVGFMAVDSIMHRHRFGSYKQKYKSEYTEGEISNQKVICIKPQTFMNLSGEAVVQWCSFFKIKPEKVLVFHDDLELKAGELKIKKGGGNAGHNGLRSITSHIGGDFFRGRIGIGRPAEKSMVSNYVLGDFVTTDLTWLNPMLDAIGNDIADFFNNQINDYVTKVNIKVASTR